jgi:lipopolysaccharide/colanic/teichoic acid biosynthesis glycosyltransferase
MQRFFDILFSTLALIVLSPLLIPIVIALRLTGEGEIFFLQSRVGKDGKSFSLYKFATMLKNSPSMGTQTVTVKNDPRILPLGHFLRNTKINELPQLLNIFFGDMSVIGPRPLTNQVYSGHPEETKRIIEKVRPGLSGIGSIIFRDEENILAQNAGALDFYKRVILPYKGKLELWYVSNNSISNYFKAIVATLVVVIRPESNIVWAWFKDLPAPPTELTMHMNYPAKLVDK